MPPPPNPNYQPKPIKPRKVRGGVRLSSASGDCAYPESWAAQRWLRLVEQVAPGAAMSAGLEYAKLGQTRSMTMEPGWIRAIVQGSVFTAYRTSISLPAYTHDQAEQVIAAMMDQAVYAAKLLAGELPANIDDVFAPLGMRLFPDPHELVAKCSCREPQPWCKHACCIAYLVAERFTTDAFVIFTLRGLPREDLVERLRQRRSAAGSGAGGAPVYTPVIPGAAEIAAPPLEQCTESFWDASPDLGEIEMPIGPPEVTHPLLRRLGPSPLAANGAKFPLVGLLATCYEVISEATIRAEAGEDSPPNGAAEHGEASADSGDASDAENAENHGDSAASDAGIDSP